MSRSSLEVESAKTLLRGGEPWIGFIVDLGLPDGSGLDVLALARSAHPLTPAIVLTGSTERTAINRAYDLRAEYVVKPVEAARVQQFIRNATSLAPRVELAVRVWTSRYGLSNAEVDILGRAGLGETRAEIAVAREASAATIQKQVTGLLRRTGDASFREAVERLLREASRA